MNLFTHDLSRLPSVVLLLLFFCISSITHAGEPEKQLEAEKQNSVLESTVSSQDEKTQQGLKTILVMGDSISAGFGVDKNNAWVSQLSLQLGEQYKVFNASVSGETSTGGRHRLAAALDKYQPELVIIELGGNDGLRGTPIKHIRANLKDMIEKSKASHAEVMILGMQIPPNYGENYTSKFSAIYHTLASEHDTLLVPFLLDGIVGQDGMMQSDGIHPTDKAQWYMMRHVWEVLQLWSGVANKN